MLAAVAGGAALFVLYVSRKQKTELQEQINALKAEVEKAKLLRRVKTVEAPRFQSLCPLSSTCRHVFSPVLVWPRLHRWSERESRVRLQQQMRVMKLEAPNSLSLAVRAGGNSLRTGLE